MMPYQDKFKPGNIAIAKRNVRFIDGTGHMVGDRILVTEETEAYYNVNHEDYDKG